MMAGCEDDSQVGGGSRAIGIVHITGIHGYEYGHKMNLEKTLCREYL